jgi:hypothetical protein
VSIDQPIRQLDESTAVRRGKQFRAFGDPHTTTMPTIGCLDRTDR